MKDLVFLHGGSHGSWCWAQLLTELRKTPALFGRLITLDVPGAGTKRGQDSSGGTIGSIARSLNDELRAADVRRAVLVGHSLAGVLMPVMAAEDASLYCDLIFLQTIAPQEGQTVHDQMGLGRHGEDPERVGFPFDPATTPKAELYTALFGADLDGRQLRWLLAETAQDATPTSFSEEPITRQGYDPARFRTAYVLARRDPILPPKWQRRFAERLGCARTVEIDTPHEAFISHPALLADTLRALIA
ncbi:MAG TPA: alpha/beta fold hydrolase [Steroidobacteraceae bacterium]|nr:alpha/beta fold hydrolase [Steroidobacteraceae bacterium]